MIALARKIVGGDEDDAKTVEAVFAAAWDAKASSRMARCRIGVRSKATAPPRDQRWYCLQSPKAHHWPVQTCPRVSLYPLLHT